MSESKKFKPISKSTKVDCNAPRTSPLFSWALCGMTGREKGNGTSTIKTSPLTVPKMKQGKGGRRRKRKTRRKRKSRRKRKTRRRRKKRKSRRRKK